MSVISDNAAPFGGVWRRRKPRIDIIPLVDVLTILIFFFVMSMQFQDVRSMDITMPVMETAGPSMVPEGLLIRLRQDGEILLGPEGQSVNRDQLVGFLRQLEGVGREVPVLLMADEAAPLGDVAFIMDQCRKVGLDRIRLQSR